MNMYIEEEALIEEDEEVVMNWNYVKNFILTTEYNRSSNAHCSKKWSICWFV